MKPTDNMQKIMYGVGAVVAIFALLWVAWKMTSQPEIAKTTAPISLPIAENDWIQGDPQAPITLVEYSDFQCPACKMYYPVIKQILDRNKDVKLVYRYFPLTQHVFAQQSAQAAEAAGQQGKFFEMHDLLFDNQDTWQVSKNIDTDMENYAKKLKLDIAKFKKVYNAPETKKRIQDNYTQGIAIGVDSTPSIYLNGVKMEQQSYDGFQKLIDAERAKLPKKDSSPSAVVSPPAK